jgi:hypothetical protein
MIGTTPAGVDGGNKMRDLTGFLYAQPSFLEGVASILDLGDTLTGYNACETGEQADRLAFRMDWKAIGADMEQALAAHEHDFQKRLSEGQETESDRSRQPLGASGSKGR